MTAKPASGRPAFERIALLLLAQEADDKVCNISHLIHHARRYELQSSVGGRSRRR